MYTILITVDGKTRPQVCIAETLFNALMMCWYVAGDDAGLRLSNA